MSTSEKSRTLIIGKHWPEPQSSAAGSRMMQLIEVFQQLGSVVFASAASPGEYSANLEEIGVQTSRIELNNTSFDHFVLDLSPDIVMFDRFMTEEQFGWRVAENVPGAIRILDTEDLHGLRFARQQAVKPGRSVNDEDLHNETMLRELAAIYRCDLSLIISEAEMDLLNDKMGVPGSILKYVPFMVSTAEEKAIRELPDFEDRKHFITIGNALHPPNRDAIQVLHDNIWDKIREQLPTAEMHVYGAYIDPSIQKLHSPSKGFVIKGRAAEVSEVMRQARLCLAPLRFGAGLKGKLIDAMQSGTPSVTTSVGAEGMAGNLPWCGRITDDFDDFAKLAVALYSDIELWKESQDRGFQVLQQRFNGDAIKQGMIKDLIGFSDNLAEHRSQNFTGSMLRHQSMRSTEYMARWIEEKNRNRG